MSGAAKKVAEAATDYAGFVTIFIMGSLVLHSIRPDITEKVFGKSKTVSSESMVHSMDVQQVKCTEERLEDVCGMEDVVEDIRVIVDFFKNPEKFKKVGARCPRGILFSGPPGTGKTMLARAIANEAGIPMFSISAGELNEVYAGVGTMRLRKVFEKARECAPSIVFIDEIDAVATKRNHGNGDQNTINYLLTAMDGFSHADGVIVLAATNMEEELDPAIKRPGRFDKIIRFESPTSEHRKKMFGVHARKFAVSPEIDFDHLVRATSGANGAEIYNYMNQAAIRAAVRGNSQIEQVDVEHVIRKAKSSSLVMSDSVRRHVAYHEAGHAVVAHFVECTHPVEYATILPAEGAAGHVRLSSDTGVTVDTFDACFAQLVVAMGGRAAETVLFGKGDVSSGVKGDMEMATNLAREMVASCSMNMSRIIPSVDCMKDASEELKIKVDTEVETLLNSALLRACQIIGEHLPEVHAVAQKLIEKETLYASDIQAAISSANN